MKDEDKTKEQLIEELKELRTQVAKQQKTEIGDIPQNLVVIFEKMDSAATIFDHQYNYLFANSFAEKILGHTKDELIGKNMFDVFPDIKDSEFHQTYQRALSSQTSQHVEIHYPAWDCLYINHIIPTEEYLCILFEDITEQKKAEEEITILRGILPICASCKKIRDDKGYWNSVEAYIEKNSEVQFSHVMCEECMAKLYGKEFLMKFEREGKCEKNSEKNRVAS